MGQWAVIAKDASAIQRVTLQASEVLRKTIVSGPVELVLRRPKRSLDQNRLMWPLLSDFSKQVEHFGNKYTSEQWKDILTSAFTGCTEYAPSLDGRGVVAFGVRTSEWPKDTFSQFIEFVFAEGADRGVKWSQQSESNVAEVRG